MRREGDPPGRRRADQSEAARDHRAQPVGADDDACVARYTLPVARVRDDARDGPFFPHQILDRCGLAHVRARAPGSAQENGVERGPRQGKAVGACALDEAPAHGGAPRRDDLHTVELRVSRALDGAEDAPAEARQDGCGAWAQVLGAGLVPGKPAAIEQQDRRARAGQEQRGRRSCRTGSDDDDIPAIGHDGAALRAAGRASRAWPRLRRRASPRGSRRRCPPIANPSRVAPARGTR